MMLLLSTLTFALCASARQTSQMTVGVFRPELNTNVEVVQLMAVDGVPDINPTVIRVKISPDSDFEVDFKCVNESKILVPTKDQAWIGCCLPNQQLKGSEATVFDCCDEGQDVTGCSIDRGYQCCTSGSRFNGTKCVTIDYENHNPCAPRPDGCPPEKIKVNGDCISPCPGGQELVNSECVPKCERCESRIYDGSCYTPPCPTWGSREYVYCTCVPTPSCPEGMEAVNGECVPLCLPPTVRADTECIDPCPGKIVDLVLDICVCPPGMKESGAGICEATKPACSPGIQAGKRGIT